MKTIDYIDALRAKHGLPSDYAAAAMLGISRQQISNYRTGRNTMDNKTAFKLAAALDLPASAIIASVEAERAQTADDREFWRHAAKVAACIMLAPLLALNPIESRAFAPSRHGAEIYILRFRRLIGAMLFAA